MDTPENYRLIAEDLKKCLKAMKKDQFSLVSFTPSNPFALATLKKDLQKNLANSFLIVDNTLFKEEKHKLKLKVFQEHENEILEKVRNGVAIHNKFEGSKEDFDLMQKSHQSYFPIMFVLYDDVNDVMTKTNDNWKIINNQSDKYLLMINKNYKSFDDYTFETFSFKKVKNLVSLKSSKEYYQASGEEIDLELETGAPKKASPVYKRNKENIVHYDIFSKLPKPSIYPPDHKSKKWLQEFYNYLNAILIIIVPEDKKRLIPYILNKKTIQEVWLSVFTHTTTNVNTGKNYEAYEAIGDKSSKHAFMIYYTTRFPYASQGDITNVLQKFESDDGQIPIGKAMGLIDWMGVPDVLKTNLKIHEDMVEAFCGGLDVILNRYTSMGSVMPILYNMNKLLYDDTDMQEDISAITFLDQLLVQLVGSKKPTVIEEKKFFLKRPRNMDPAIFEEVIECGNNVLSQNTIAGSFTSEQTDQEKDKKIKGFEFKEYRTAAGKLKVDVVMTQAGVEIINRYGFNFRSGYVIGSASDATAKPAKRHAADNARDNLAKKGLTKKWLDKQKMERNMSDMGDLKKEILLKAKQLHPDIVSYVIKTKKLMKDNIFMLVGENKDGYGYILETYITADSLKNNFLIVAKNFLNIED